MQKRLIIFCLVTALILTSCSNTPFQKDSTSFEVLDLSRKIYTEFDTGLNKELPSLDTGEDEGWNYFDYGIATAEGEILNDAYVELSSGDSFEGFFAIHNDLGKDENFTLVILDQFQQVPFQVENTTVLSCTVFIENHHSLQIPFQIAELADGEHPLLFIIFTDTNRLITSQESAEISIIDSYTSCLLKIGNDDADYQFGEVQQIPTKAIDLQNYFFLKEEENKIHASIANLNEYDSCYIVVLMNNYLQISSNIGDQMFYLPASQQADFSLSNDFMNSGPNEIEGMLIELFDENDSSDQLVRNVYFSNRITRK